MTSAQSDKKQQPWIKPTLSQIGYIPTVTQGTSDAGFGDNPFPFPPDLTNPPPTS